MYEIKRGFAIKGAIKLIKLICDLCSKECDAQKDYEFDIPRNIRYYATGKNGVKLMAFDEVRQYKTHLCRDCGVRIAALFPTVE